MALREDIKMGKFASCKKNDLITKTLFCKADENHSFNFGSVRNSLNLHYSCMVLKGRKRSSSSSILSSKTLIKKLEKKLKITAP